MKQSFFKYLFSVLFFLTAFTLSAQTSGGTGDDTLAVVMAFIQKWGIFILAIWEVVIRYIPTAQSLSFMTLFIRIIQFLVPDQKAVVNGANVTAFGAHDASVKQLLNTPLQTGDKIKTKGGKVVQIQKFVNSGTLLTTEQKTIPVTDVIEVVKTAYTLIDALKSLFTFFKSLFSKNKPTTN